MTSMAGLKPIHFQWETHGRVALIRLNRQCHRQCGPCNGNANSKLHNALQLNWLTTGQC